MSNKSDQASIDAAKPQQPATASVTLETPIVRGEQKITDVTLRKPGSGELRGASLTDLLQMDVASLVTVLPRISSPSLTTHDVTHMDPADMVQMGTVVISFLLPKAAREQASLGA